MLGAKGAVAVVQLHESRCGQVRLAIAVDVTDRCVLGEGQGLYLPEVQISVAQENNSRVAAGAFKQVEVAVPIEVSGLTEQKGTTRVGVDERLLKPGLRD